MQNPTGTGFFSGLNSLVENLGSKYLQIETLKNGGNINPNLGNDGSDFGPVTTGVNSNGDTLIARRVIPGVSNSNAMFGAIALVVAGLLTYAILND